MVISVFTSNQPRHVALIEALAGIADRVYAIQECNTLFPGEVQDFFRKSPVMRDYFSRVIAAEKEVFGAPRLLPANVRSMPMKMGDVSRVPMDCFGGALNADRFVVFGASFIKGPLCDRLVAGGALNIHMGVSPYYRGSSTNFWAMYDDRPDLVGATIHLLSKGLDSGPILFHALAKPDAVDPFVHGMRSVRAAHRALAEYVRSGEQLDAVAQDKSRELRYSRNAEFTDQIASEYLARVPCSTTILEKLTNRDMTLFVRPQCH